MKIEKRKSKKRTVVIIVVAIVLLVTASAFTYVYAMNGKLFGWEAQKAQNKSNNQGTVNNGPATSEQQKAGSAAKSGSKETPPAPAPIPGSNQKSVQVLITSANQNQSGSPLVISSQIGAVVDSGTCTLTLTKAEETNVTKTAGVQALASTSTCQGFDIPASELSVGTWHILLEYSSSTLTGSAAKDVVIK